MMSSTRLPSPPPQWIENFAKAGLAAKGLVYCLIGVPAFQPRPAEEVFLN